MNLPTSPAIAENSKIINSNQDKSDGLKQYLNNWYYQKVRSNEIVSKNLNRQYRLLRDSGKHQEAEKLYKIIKRIDRCRKDFVKFHLEDNSHQKKRLPYYCQNRLCPICYPYQSYKRGLQIYSKMLSVGGGIYGVYTFSPKNFSVDEFEQEISKLKTLSRKVFNPQCKKLSLLINGSIRFMGLNYTPHNGFNAHLHVIIHLTRMLTESEALGLYELLNKRFKKYMGVDHSETHLGIYEQNPENVQRTASYLTKYADHQNISDSLSHMSVDRYEAYQGSYGEIREIEYAGCYRGKLKSTLSLDQLKKSFKRPDSDNNPPVKIYEFKPPREIR